MEQHLFFRDLTAEATEVERGIHSQTISKGDGVEVILFSLAAGEQLSEHTSARPAIVHVLRGSGQLTVGGEQHDIGPGSWLRMATRTPHAIVATQPIVFALYLLPRAADVSG